MGGVWNPKGQPLGILAKPSHMVLIGAPKGPKTGPKTGQNRVSGPSRTRFETSPDGPIPLEPCSRSRFYATLWIEIWSISRVTHFGHLSGHLWTGSLTPLGAVSGDPWSGGSQKGSQKRSQKGPQKGVLGSGRLNLRSVKR